MKKKNEVTEELIETPEVETEVELDVEPELDNITEAEEETPEVEETPEAEEDTEKTGVVTCAKLNVREKPSKDSKVLIVINEKTEVIIDLDESTEEFYKVYVLGFAGYCVKQFIQII